MTENSPPKGDAFFWNLLRVLSRSDMQNNRTVEEIREKYEKVHPRGILGKFFTRRVSLVRVERTLRRLHKYELVSRELVRFWKGKYLKEDLPVYHISCKGSHELRQKKNKS